MTQAAPRDGGTQKCVIPAVEDKDIGLVSLPFFQFLLFRWYYRLFIWARRFFPQPQLGSDVQR